MKRFLIALCLLGTVLALTFTGAPSALAATLKVCPSGCTYSKIQDAINHASNGDTIHVAAGTYTENLTIPGTSGANQLTLTGAGQSTTIIDGGKLSCVLTINSGTVSISDLTIQDGVGSSSTPNGSGISNSGTLTLKSSTVTSNVSPDSAGIYNNGTFTLQGSTITDNAGPSEVGIYNSGTATMTNSTVSNNTYGGILNYPSATFTVTGSAITNNTWGGIDNNQGTFTLTNSTVSGNTESGGISNSGTLTVTGSTVSGNTGGSGIDCASSSGAYAHLTLTHSSVTGNTSNGDGGGIWVRGCTLTLTNSTVSGNTPDDLSTVAG